MKDELVPLLEALGATARRLVPLRDDIRFRDVVQLKNHVLFTGVRIISSTRVSLSIIHVVIGRLHFENKSEITKVELKVSGEVAR